MRGHQPPDGLELTVLVDGPTRVVVATGEIDLATVPQFHEALARAAASGEKVVVDLRACTFIDSTGIHELVLLRRRSPDLAILADSPMIRRTFEVIGLSDMLSRG